MKDYIQTVGWTPKSINYLIYRAYKSLISRTFTLSKRIYVGLLLSMGKDLPENLRWLGYLRALGPAINKYKYNSINCRATLIYRDMDQDGRDMVHSMWSEILGPEVEIEFSEGAAGHNDFMEDPHLSNLSRLLDNRIMQ